MRTEDHVLLARSLVKNLNISNRHKRAFIMGNEIPDHNRLTYMGRNIKYFGNGHSFKARRHQIIRYLNKPYKDSLLWWYFAGIMFHYLTDSFSRPHNPEFAYSSKEHVAYEWRLHRIFPAVLLSNHWEIPVVEGELFSWINHRHKVYMHRSKDIRDDCYYIITTVTAVWRWVVDTKVSAVYS